jgi:UDP:flavonoid glycosyltransferase YjiC (YdhE family)
MAKVVIAWELGEAWGHLARCLRLAQSLRLRGHSVILVLKEVKLPVAWQGVAGLRVLAAPFTRQHRPQERPCNYAAVLNCCGFHDVEDMVSRLRVWTDIFYLLKPHVVVADYAPTALLAAATCRIPYMAVGNGFAIPPAQSPWPSIQLEECVSDSRLHEAEAIVNDVIVRAQQQLFGTVVVDNVRALFGPQDLLDTFAELDHYGGL